MSGAPQVSSRTAAGKPDIQQHDPDAGAVEDNPEISAMSGASEASSWTAAGTLDLQQRDPDAGVIKDNLKKSSNTGRLLIELGDCIRHA